jgi:hypothetical protein
MFPFVLAEKDVGMFNEHATFPSFPKKKSFLALTHKKKEECVIFLFCF